MAATTISKKRKSTDGSSLVSKKVKITKSADKPAPLKSALKKSDSSTSVQRPTHNGSTKKTTTKRVIEQEDEDVAEAPELTPDQTAALLAGFSSDSSDNEASDTESDGLALASLPKAPTSKKLQKQLSQAASEADPESTPSVLYIGRVPHGFHEPQMRSYFGQFGTILNLRLARNKKTGRSQHYAFVEFASAAVAEIVRKTMDKYLLFGHLLQVRHVPRDAVQEGMFNGSGRNARRRAPRNRIEGRKLERGMTREEWSARVEREQRKRVEKAKVLEEMGYEFEMPAVKGVADVPAKVLVTGEEVGGGAEEEVEREKLLADGEDTEKAEPNGISVVEEVSKKRSAHGKTATKKKVKKIKT